MSQRRDFPGRLVRSLIGERRLTATLVAGYVLRVSNLFLRFLVAVFLARLLGPEGYGTYAFAIALVTVLAIPVQLGIPKLVERETARAHADRQWGRMRILWRWSFRIILGFSLLSVLLFYTLVHAAPQLLPAGVHALVLPGLALIPLLSLSAVRAAALRGLRRVISGQLPEALVLPGAMLLLLGIVGILGPMTARGALMVQLGAAALAFLAGMLMLQRARPAEVASAAPVEAPLRRWLGSALTLSFVAGMQLVNSQADILMLGYMRTAEEVGVYRVSASAAVLTLVGLQVVNTVVGPRFARLHTQGREAELRRLVTRTSRAIALISLPVGLLLIVLAEPLLGFFFGEPYQRGALVLQILVLAQTVNFLSGPVGNLLTMSGREGATLGGVAVAAVVNVALNFLLIPRFGIEGAAIAWAASIVCWNLLLWWFAWHLLGIDTSPVGRHRAGVQG